MMTRRDNPQRRLASIAKAIRIPISRKFLYHVEKNRSTEKKKLDIFSLTSFRRLAKANRFQPAIPFRGERSGASFKGFFKALVLPASGTSILPVASKHISRSIRVSPPPFLIPPSYALRFSELGRHRQLVSLSYRFG